MQRELDFPGYVWGLPRPDAGSTGVPGGQMTEITSRFGRLLGRHAQDQVLDGTDPAATS